MVIKLLKVTSTRRVCGVRFTKMANTLKMSKSIVFMVLLLLVGMHQSNADAEVPEAEPGASGGVTAASGGGTTATPSTVELSHVSDNKTLTFNEGRQANCTLEGLQRCSCTWDSVIEHLTIVNCSDVGFTNMSSLASVGDTVETILFTGNDLIILDPSVLSSATSLKMLDLSSNNIIKVATGGFSRLPQLETLILNTNNWLVGEDTGPIFVNLSLKHLSLNSAFAGNYNDTMKHGTNLRFLFGDEGVLGSLEELYLQSNNLYFADSEIFCNMHVLRLLDLSHNQISELPCNATCLSPIQTLLVQNNSLGRISVDFVVQMQPSVLSLAKLDISDNPFVCDCHMVDDYEWLKNESSAYVFQRDKLLCRFPDSMNGRSIMQLENADFVCDPNPVIINKEFSRGPIVFGVLFALVVVAVLVALFIYRHRIRQSVFGRRHGTTTMTAGYSSMDG